MSATRFTVSKAPDDIENDGAAATPDVEVVGNEKSTTKYGKFGLFSCNLNSYRATFR